MSLNDQGERLRQEIKVLADGKIICACGNRDWQQFLYIKNGDYGAAGCKKCGTMFVHTGGVWKETMKGPGRTA